MYLNFSFNTIKEMQRQVGFNVILRYRGTVSVLIMDARTGRAQRNFSLNLGGNTDDTFALSIRCSGFFFIIDWYWRKKEV